VRHRVELVGREAPEELDFAKGFGVDHKVMVPADR
jgi:hypothetical protein